LIRFTTVTLFHRRSCLIFRRFRWDFRGAYTTTRNSITSVAISEAGVILTSSLIQTSPPRFKRFPVNRAQFVIWSAWASIRRIVGCGSRGMVVDTMTMIAIFAAAQVSRTVLVICLPSFLARSLQVPALHPVLLPYNPGSFCDHRQRPRVRRFGRRTLSCSTIFYYYPRNPPHRHRTPQTGILRCTSILQAHSAAPLVLSLPAHLAWSQYACPPIHLGRRLVDALHSSRLTPNEIYMLTRDPKLNAK